MKKETISGNMCLTAWEKSIVASGYVIRFMEKNNTQLNVNVLVSLSNCRKVQR